jgi:hypothetical protein
MSCTKIVVRGRSMWNYGPMAKRGERMIALTARAADYRRTLAGNRPLMQHGESSIHEVEDKAPRKAA